MKLARVKIRNFRCYTDEVSFELGDLTSLIGKNDAGRGCQMVCVRGVGFLRKEDTDDHDRQGSSSAAAA